MHHIKLIQRAGQTKPDFADIVHSIDGHFQKIKKALPLAYMDSFESRFLNICEEVAQKLKAKIHVEPDDTVVFDVSEQLA